MSCMCPVKYVGGSKVCGIFLTTMIVPEVAGPCLSVRIDDIPAIVLRESPSGIRDFMCVEQLDNAK